LIEREKWKKRKRHRRLIVGNSRIGKKHEGRSILSYDLVSGDLSMVKGACQRRKEKRKLKEGNDRSSKN